MHQTDLSSATPPLASLPARRANAKLFFIAAKVLVTGVAFWLVLRLVDRNAFFKQVQTLDLRALGAVLLVFTLQIPLVTLRWRLILRALDPATHAVSYARLFDVTFIGQFFGQVLPFVAGDAMKTWALGRSGPCLKTAFTSVVIDRGVATLALCALAVPPLLFAPVLQHREDISGALLIIIGLAFSGFAVLMLAAGFLSRLKFSWGLANVLIDTVVQTRRVLLRPGTALCVGLISCIVHGSTMLTVWLLAWGQGLPLAALDAAALVPPVLLVSMLPVAIGGWGVREGVVIALLGASGIDPDSALLLSLSFGGMLVVAALPGLFIWLLHARQSPPSTATPSRLLS